MKLRFPSSENAYASPHIYSGSGAHRASSKGSFPWLKRFAALTWKFTSIYIPSLWICGALHCLIDRCISRIKSMHVSWSWPSIFQHKNLTKPSTKPVKHSPIDIYFQLILQISTFIICLEWVYDSNSKTPVAIHRYTSISYLHTGMP